MLLSELSYSDGVPIDSYGPGFFRIAGKIYHGGVILAPNYAGSWGGYDDRAVLLGLASSIDVLFVGTGDQLVPAPADFRKAIDATGIGFENMNSPAACRTYNVLLSEGRRVAVALFPV